MYEYNQIKVLRKGYGTCLWYGFSGIFTMVPLVPFPPQLFSSTQISLKVEVAEITDKFRMFCTKMQFFYKEEKYDKIISFLIDHAKNFGISHYYVILINLFSDIQLKFQCLETPSKQSLLLVSYWLILSRRSMASPSYPFWQNPV